MIRTRTRSRSPQAPSPAPSPGPALTHRLAHRLAAAALTAGLVLGFTVAATAPAQAHPSDGMAADQAHAATDLVGVPVSQIERDTAANKARLTKATGEVPGRRMTKATLKSRTLSVADRATLGEWDPTLRQTSLVPVFQALLPSGRVLMWDSVGDGPTESYDDHSSTRALVWDPTSDTAKDVPVVGYNLFCAGYVQLADGNVLVAGGNKDKALAGIVQTHLFDWRSETWSRGPDMAAGRWYPSVAALANGEALILGGGPSTAEVYQTDGTLRRQTGYTTPSNRLYPFLVPRGDGQVEYVGPQNAMYTIDTAGAGAITSRRNRDGVVREYGSFATYDIGKTLVTGGATAYKNGGRAPVSSSVVVTTNGTTAVAATKPMASPRSQHTLTVLADGSVLATGGLSAFAGDDLVNLNAAVYAAERWNPSTGNWTTLASAQVARQYHSAALLLPDGRVLTGGGGICGACVAKSYLEKNIEYYSPPYLFAADGSKASRPTISAVPSTLTYNTSFTLSTPQASSIRKVALNRLGAPTHAEDQGQRFVPLTYTAGSGSLTVAAPGNGRIAPPGYYQLTVTDASGVPSVASIVKVGAGDPITTPQATTMRLRDVAPQTCLDPPNGVVTKGTRVRLWTCNGTPGQLWTARADKTLRNQGACLDISGNNRVAGTAVQFWTCSANTAQQWARGTDGYVRSAATPSLCLSTVDGATAIRTELQLQPCDGRAGQRWTW